MFSYGTFLLIAGMAITPQEVCTTTTGAKALIEYKAKRQDTLPKDCTRGVEQQVVVDGVRNAESVPFRDREAYVIPVLVEGKNPAYVVSAAPFAKAVPVRERYVLAPAWHLSDREWVVCVHERHAREVLDIHRRAGHQAASRRLDELEKERTTVDGVVEDSSCTTLQKRVRFHGLVHEEMLPYNDVPLPTQIVNLEEGFNNKRWYALTTNMTFFEPMRQ